MKRSESRIALDEADWAVRVGLLHIALGQGIEKWYSANRQYLYTSIAAHYPFGGLPSYDSVHDVPATIPDPEFITEQFEVISPGKWIVNRVLTEDHINYHKHAPKRVKGSKGVAPKPVGFTSYLLQEKESRVLVIECPDGFHGDFIKRETPTHRDIADLCEALDDLWGVIGFHVR